MQDYFGYPELYDYSYEVQYVLSRSKKNCDGNLMGIALSLKIGIGKMAIFTVVILSINEHGKYFQLLISSLMSFLKDLKFCHTGIHLLSERYTKISYSTCWFPDFSLNP